jgi:LPXTG-site transpeptidase (sortase) family protein
MKNLFERHEIQFIAWFSGIFLVSVLLLSMLGLLPSEFMPEGGKTFEQVVSESVREMVDGRPLDPSRQSGSGIFANTDSNDSANNNTNANAGAGQNTNTGNNTTNGGGTNIGNSSSGFGNANMGTGLNGGMPTGTIDTSSQIKTNTGTTMYAEEPTRLVIPTISLDSAVNNPKSTNYETLDAALTKSPVRYPGSGLPGIGNMFIFGHSTGFSVVQNQAYKVFNKIKNVKVGATVTVYSKSATYEYRVTSVRLVDKSIARVDFNTTKNMLTLSTCNSFGSDEDRYVLEADLISVTKTK